MANHEDKRISHDDDFSKRGGYISSANEMTIPTVPDGPGPGSEGTENLAEQGDPDDE